MYAAADVAFVGGSLYYRGANKGGHNLMEPAILGLPVVFGPYNFSFRETVADLLAADAGLLVRDREELRRTLVELAASASRRAELGQRARSVVLNGQGASARNLELLLPLLGARSCSASTEDAQCRHQSSSHPFNE
jgi:3-deoxy-D-manno-octulosonic-acid transferase